MVQQLDRATARGWSGRVTFRQRMLHSVKFPGSNRAKFPHLPPSGELWAGPGTSGTPGNFGNPAQNRVPRPLPPPPGVPRPLLPPPRVVYIAMPPSNEQNKQTTNGAKVKALSTFPAPSRRRSRRRSKRHQTPAQHLQRPVRVTQQQTWHAGATPPRSAGWAKNTQLPKP